MHSRWPGSWVDRYAAFLDRRRYLVVAVSLAIAVVGLLLTLRLPILTDTSALLPPSAESVRHLRAIEKRARAAATILVVVVAPDEPRRAAAAEALRARLAALSADEITDQIHDDRGLRRWFWSNRFLFAPLADLEEAERALRSRIERAKLEANPAYVSFEDEEAAPETDQRLADLEKKWRDAEAIASQPTWMLNKDRRAQLFVLRTPHMAAEVAKGKPTVEWLRRVADEVAAAHPGVEIGLAGDVVTGLVEQRAILSGMATSTVLTVVLVTIGLLLYFKSMVAVVLILAALGVGLMATFGFAQLTIGNLNSVSAFLAAIVIGVGIDFGILLVARWFEELRNGAPRTEALAHAMATSAHGTLAAACATGAAYASLIVTDFRGFREFGIIGGAGMALCWLSAYTTLPALMAILARSRRLRPTREPGIGVLLGRLFPNHRLPLIGALSGLVTLAAGAAAWHYLASDPFEYDWSRLRSTGKIALEARRWQDFVNHEFGHGITGAFVIAVPSRADVPVAARALASLDDGTPVERKQLRYVASLDDLVPRDQAKKLALLAELRRLLDDDALAALDDEERARLERFRPPADLRALVDADVPASLRMPFTERDGSYGRLLFAHFGPGVEHWNGKSLARFADEVRALELPAGTAVGGTAFVFTDIQRAVKRDGLRATLVAIAGVLLFVIVLVGTGTHALVTVACVAAGTLLMIAGAWLMGLRVNFLDFAALPLTLGISVDYSVNIVLRHKADLRHTGSAIDRDTGTLRALTTTGGAVVLCSYTTIVGYGSLILSENAGIRSFGLAATLGEITCLAIAVTMGPALLYLLHGERTDEKSRSC